VVRFKHNILFILLVTNPFIKGIKIRKYEVLENVSPMAIDISFMCTKIAFLLLV